MKDERNEKEGRKRSQHIRVSHAVSRQSKRETHISIVLLALPPRLLEQIRQRFEVLARLLRTAREIDREDDMSDMTTVKWSKNEPRANLASDKAVDTREL